MRNRARKEEETNKFVSNRAIVTMERVLMSKDFISKICFNMLISPFKEAIEKRG